MASESLGVRIDFNVNDTPSSIRAFLRRLAAVWSTESAAEPVVLDLSKCQYVGPDCVILTSSTLLDLRAGARTARLVPPAHPRALAYCHHAGLLAIAEEGAPPKMQPESGTMPLRRFRQYDHAGMDEVIRLVRGSPSSASTFPCAAPWWRLHSGSTMTSIAGGRRRPRRSSCEPNHGGNPGAVQKMRPPVHRRRRGGEDRPRIPGTLSRFGTASLLRRRTGPLPKCRSGPSGGREQAPGRARRGPRSLDRPDSASQGNSGARSRRDSSGSATREEDPPKLRQVSVARRRTG